MKKALIVAYYFPPMGMGGVQRATKFVKYLPEFGWEPLVLTVKNVWYRQHDSELNREVRRAKIFRTESLDPLRIVRPFFRHEMGESGAMSRHPSIFENLNAAISPWLCVPDAKIAWAPFAFSSGIRIVRRFGVDVVMTTSPPNSSHLVGLLLKKTTAVPWIADFRDSWMLEMRDRVPTAFHKKMNKEMLKTVLRHADRIVGVSEPVLKDMESLSGRNGDVFSHIPNGFDMDDFREVRRRNSKRFRITYCGTVSSYLSPETFIKGLSLAVGKRPDLKNHLEVRFAGSVSGVDFEGMLDHAGIRDRVRIMGYVPHAESVRRLMDSDLLVLILPDHSSVGWIPGKIFEYLASGLPILGVVPDGEAKRLIIENQRGFTVHPRDVEGIATAILQFFDRWRLGTLKIGSSRWKGMDVFDRRQQTRLLARIFDESSGPKFST
jgi:glycosyltransferase involved in cell wall biosynthesis